MGLSSSGRTALLSRAFVTYCSLGWRSKPVKPSPKHLLTLVISRLLGIKRLSSGLKAPFGISWTTVSTSNYCLTCSSIKKSSLWVLEENREIISPMRKGAAIHGHYFWGGVLGLCSLLVMISSIHPSPRGAIKKDQFEHRWSPKASRCCRAGW